jgi:translation elongation factor EF-G
MNREISISLRAASFLAELAEERLDDLTFGGEHTQDWKANIVGTHGFVDFDELSSEVTEAIKLLRGL